MKTTRAIFAARSVFGRLARPLPDLLDNLSMVQNCGLLTQDLPLADESPFSALPDSVAAGGRGSQSAQRGGRAEVAPRRISTPRPAPDVARTPGDTPSPVFSFRRKGSAGRAAQPAPSVSAPDDALGSRPPGGSEAGPVSAARTQRAREPLGISPIAPRENAMSAAPSPSYAAAESSSSAEAPIGPSSAGVHGFELLNMLASELFAAPEPLRSTASGMPAAPSVESPDASAEAAVIRDRTSPDGPPAVSGRSWAGALRPELEHRSAPDASIMPPLRLVRTNPPLSASPLDALSGPNSLDAETIASMVNEVLAEQARRHGVDLS